MHVQVNTTGIENKETLDRWAEQHLQEQLSRFRQDITRVEVHLSDENSEKSGLADKRCTMEARLVNHQPVVVHHDGHNQDEAFRGATDKLKRVVESSLERLRDNRHRERDSIRKDGVLDTPVGEA
jgi:ribosome-associated translation inhibitor RaiA